MRSCLKSWSEFAKASIKSSTFLGSRSAAGLLSSLRSPLRLICELDSHPYRELLAGLNSSFARTVLYRLYISASKDSKARLSPRCCCLLRFFIALLTVSRKKAAWAAKVSGSRRVFSQTVRETSWSRAASEGGTSEVDAVPVLDEVGELSPEGQQLLAHIELYKDDLNREACPRTQPSKSS